MSKQEQMIIALEALDGTNVAAVMTADSKEHLNAILNLMANKEFMLVNYEIITEATVKKKK